MGFKPELLLAHADFVRSLARSLVLDENRADDVVQQTWLTALERPPQAMASLRKWLATVTRNFALLARREDKHRAAREQVVAWREGTESTTRVIEWESIRRHVVEAVLSLDEPYRSAIVLRYYENLPPREIATRLNIPVETARTRVKRGIAKLRGYLDSVHGGDRPSWRLALVPIAGLKLALPSAGVAVAAKSTLTGGLVMATKVKLGIAGILVVGMSILMWQVFSDGNRMGDSATSTSSDKDRLLLSEADVASDEAELNRDRIALEPESQNGVASEKEDTAKAHVRVRFVDGEGTPLQGVETHVWGTRALEISGPDGRVSAAIIYWSQGQEVEEELRCHLVAKKTGYMEKKYSINVRLGESLDLGDLILEAGGAISGRVTDSLGVPVPGAQVLVSDTKIHNLDLDRLRRIGPIPRNDEFHERTRSGEDGTFEFRSVPAHDVRVWAKLAGTFYSFTDLITVHAGDNIENVVLVLDRIPKEECIKGMVLDPEGKPVSRASVSLFTGDRRRRGIHSDEQGRFCFEQGHAFSEIEAQGGFTVEAIDGEQHFEAVRIENVALGDVNLILQFVNVRPVLRISVISVDGIPVKDFQVRIDYEEWLPEDRAEKWDHSDEAFNRDHRRPYFKRSSRSQDLEKTNLTEMPAPGKKFYMEVEAEGYESVRLGPMDPAALPDPVVAILPPIPGVMGRVLAQGRPVDGAVVTLHRPVHDGRVLKLSDQFLCRSHRAVESKATTNGEGCYSIWPRKTGRFYLRVEKAGFAPSEIYPVDIKPGTRMTELDIALTVGGCIEGRIFLPPGENPRGVVVAANRGDGFPLRVKADSNGNYRFLNLTPDSWQIVKCQSDLLYGFSKSLGWSKEKPPFEWSCVVKDGLTTHHDIDLRVEHECVLNGVFTVDGSVPVNWSFLLSPVGADDSDTAADLTLPPESLKSDGQFTVRITDPGRYQLTFDGSFGAERRSRWCITDRIELVRGENEWSCAFSLGELRLEGGKAVEQERSRQRFILRWEGPGNQEGRALFRLDSDGTAFFSALPSGKCQVLRHVYSKREAAWVDEVVAEVIVPAGGTATLDIGQK